MAEEMPKRLAAIITSIPHSRCRPIFCSSRVAEEPSAALHQALKVASHPHLPGKVCVDGYDLTCRFRNSPSWYCSIVMPEWQQHHLNFRLRGRLTPEIVAAIAGRDACSATSRTGSGAVAGVGYMKRHTPYCLLPSAFYEYLVQEG